MPDQIKIKLIYFLIYSGLAVWLSFFNVHLEQIGFTGLQIGFINSIYVSTSILVIPLGGILSDRYGSYLILFILTIISGMLIFSLGLTTDYTLLIILMLALSVFNQPVNAVIDGITLKYLKNGDRQVYGKFRLWGSFGFAAGAFVTGYLAFLKSAQLFLLSAGLIWLGAFLVSGSVRKIRKSGDEKVNLSSLGIFYKNANLRSMLLLILFFGFSVSPLHYFINLYFTSIGATQEQIGVAFAVQAFFEIPLFFLGIRYLKSVGPEKVIVIAMLVSVFRMVLYGLTADPGTAIFIGLLHGFTISFFLIGVVDYVQRQTPEFLRTTAQALILSFHFGAGLAIGNVWVGFLKDLVGMHSVMWIQSVISLLVVIVTVLFFKYAGLSENLFRKV